MAEREWIELNHYRDVPIQVSLDGHFYAQIGEVKETVGNISELKLWIDKELNIAASATGISLAVVAVLPSGRIIHTTVVGLNRTTRDLQFSDKTGKTGKTTDVNYVIPDTPENVARLERLVKAEREYKAVREVVNQRLVSAGRGYGRIAAEDYPEHLAAVEKVYQEALAKDAAPVAAEAGK